MTVKCDVKVKTVDLKCRERPLCKHIPTGTRFGQFESVPFASRCRRRVITPRANFRFILSSGHNFHLPLPPHESCETYLFFSSSHPFAVAVTTTSTLGLPFPVMIICIGVAFLRILLFFSGVKAQGKKIYRVLMNFRRTVECFCVLLH